MYHYARAVAFAAKGRGLGAGEIEALARIERDTDFKPFAEWNVPAKEIVQTARLVATGRLAEAKGDLDGAAHAYEDAIFVEDSLAYTEPPYWYYPVRQSLGSVQAAPGQAGRGGEELPRVARARAQQRLGAGGTRGNLPAQGRRGRREAHASRVRERVVRRSRRPVARRALAG